MRRNPHISLEERKLIEQMIKQGHSINFIKNELKRSYNGIATEIRISGGREQYSAEEAQKRRKMNRGREVWSALSDRICALEMQLEILVGVIRELQNQRDKNED